MSLVFFAGVAFLAEEGVVFLEVGSFFVFVVGVSGLETEFLREDEGFLVEVCFLIEGVFLGVGAFLSVE